MFNGIESFLYERDWEGGELQFEKEKSGGGKGHDQELQNRGGG